MIPSNRSGHLREGSGCCLGFQLCELFDETEANRDLVATTLNAMHRVSEIRAKREGVFYRQRMAGNKAARLAEDRKLVLENQHLLPSEERMVDALAADEEGEEGEEEENQEMLDSTVNDEPIAEVLDQPVDMDDESEAEDEAEDESEEEFAVRTKSLVKRKAKKPVLKMLTTGGFE
jgi:hypothetical protein